MAKHDHLLQWEIDWVMSHPEHYDGIMHQRAVVNNMIKNKHIGIVLKLVSKWHERPTTGVGFKITDYLGITNE